MDMCVLESNNDAYNLSVSKFCLLSGFTFFYGQTNLRTNLTIEAPCQSLNINRLKFKSHLATMFRFDFLNSFMNYTIEPD